MRKKVSKKSKTNPQIIFDGQHEKIWIDINGDMWKVIKATHQLYKSIKGGWKKIEDAILEQLNFGE